MCEDKSVITGAEVGVCYYNDGVGCDEHNLCMQCGWSPSEYQRRIRILREQQARGETPHVQVSKRNPLAL